VGPVKKTDFIKVLNFSAQLEVFWHFSEQFLP